MSLLLNQDASYWLAKIIAAPNKAVYSRAELVSILASAVRMANTGLSGLSFALQNSAVVVFHQDEITRLIYPLTDRTSAFNNKYTILLQNSGSTITAPDLKEDVIELLVFVRATLDGLRQIEGSVGWFEKVFGDFGAAATDLAIMIYKALVGVAKAALAAISTATYIAIGLGSLYFYHTYIAPKRR